MYKIFESGEQINVARRQVVDTTKKHFYIKSGYVGLYIGSGKNRRMLVMMRTGNIFPLYVTVDDQLWQSEVHYIAMNNASLSAIPSDKFLKERYNMNKKDLREKLAKSMQGNILLMERIVNLLTYDVSKRFYMRLLILVDYLGTKHGDVAVLDIPLTYADLAESIGTTRETINRLITSLQNDGIVSIANRTITIKSIERLRKLYDESDAPL